VENGLGQRFPDAMDVIARWRDNADALPPNLKLGMLMGEDAGQRYRRHYYVKAMNLVRRLRQAYDPETVIDLEP
jgi:amidase